MTSYCSQGIPDSMTRCSPSRPVDMKRGFYLGQGYGAWTLPSIVTARFKTWGGAHDGREQGSGWEVEDAWTYSEGGFPVGWNGMYDL